MNHPPPSTLSQLSDADLDRMEQELSGWEHDDRRENALLYYRPNSDRVLSVHRSIAKTIGIGGGNRSGKTDSTLAEICALSTGIIPFSLRDEPAFLSKFRGPIRIRIVCKSLTTNLYEVMIRKLRWFEWNGIGQPGSDQGHYGWIPKNCLIEHDWSSSWSEKFRILRYYCRDPKDPNRILGESSIQIMSGDQEHHQSAEYHIILLDEPPDYGIWKESIARVMSLGGRIYLAMTWPDDPAFPVDWLFDEIYDKAQPGPNKDPHTDWFNLYTTENPNIDQKEIAIRAGQMGDVERAVRLYGQPIRFSNRIHPLFTDQTQGWCFACGKTAMVQDGVCLDCQSTQTTTYCHVTDTPIQSQWPVVLLLDPHPRKPHMLSYWAVDPHDDLWCIGEVVEAESPALVKQACDDFEQEHHLTVVQRLMDPNMGRSPSGTNRETTWQDEFASAGLPFDLANDSDVGRSRINEYLKPNTYTKAPRIHWHPRCTMSILQFKRYCWNESRDPEQRGQRQTPKPMHDDFPTLAKYLLNSDPCFRYLKGGQTPVVLCQSQPTKGY